MKIVNTYNYPNEIPTDQLQKSDQRKWYHWNRIYVIESEGRFAAISLNFFERLAHIVFRVDYFKEVLGEKAVKVISSSTLPKPVPALPIPNPIPASPIAPVLPTKTLASPVTSSITSTMKKPTFVVDVVVARNASDYDKAIMNIITGVAGRNFGQKLTHADIDQSTSTEMTLKPKRVIVLFCVPPSRSNLQNWNEHLNSCAEAVGEQGRVVFAVLFYSKTIDKESIKHTLFHTPEAFQISEELQTRIEANSYLRDGAGGFSADVREQMSSDLKAIFDQMN